LRRKINTQKRLQKKRHLSQKRLSKFDAGIIMLIVGAIIFFSNGFKIPLPIFGEEIEIFLIIFGRMLELHITNSTFWKIIGLLLMAWGISKSIIEIVKINRFKKSSRKD